MLKEVQTIYSFWGRHFNLYAAVTFFTFLGKEKFLRQRTVNKLDLQHGDTVFDLACGSGKNFSFLEEAVGGTGHIVGFDYSAEMLKAAHQVVLKNKWQNIELIQGDAAQLNIKQKDIDGAISVLGLSAIPEYRTAIKEVRNVLKEGGTFAVCDAKLFEGFLSFLNPLIKLLYKKGAAWDWGKDIPKEMEIIFGNVVVENFLSSAFYVALSIK